LHWTEAVCKASVENLNELIRREITLRDMFKKHHWQVAGPTFYELDLLYDKHYKEQSELVDALAGADSNPGRDQHRNVASCRRDVHHSSISGRPGGDAGSVVSTITWRRSHSVEVADHG